MALTPGSRLGPFEIAAQIGVGGMGEVYRATDTNLRRQVAIKVLPAAMAADGERLARFQREAEVLAALNHPNIAHIHGLEKAEGQTALVMELVEGPTLADRIAEGPIPVDEALPIAKQIAEALEAAHEQGIVHRDLKPANVKVRPDGTVKVLDFGLAKVMDERAGSDVSVTHSPTLSIAATQQGLILGTAAYMSPEQAKGRATDKRTDVWAFGCVLYEMLSGRRAFEGDDAPEILASVIKGTTDLDRLPANLHPTVRKVLHRCLEKDVTRRLRDIGDVRFDLEQLLAGREDTGERRADQEAVPARSRSLVVAWIVAGVATIALLTLAAERILTRDAPPRISRFAHVLPEGQTVGYLGFGAVALSADGRQLAYSGPLGLFLRPLIAFTSDRGDTPGIWWQPADGSAAAEPLTVAEEGTEHWPTSWSPDGRTLAFTVAARNRPEEGAIWTLSLDQPEEPELYYDVPGSSEAGAVFSPDGSWLAYWSREVTGGNQIWVQPFPRTGANRHRVTEDGGTYPLWSADGRRIYYRRAFGTTVDLALNAIDVELGSSPAWGRERTLPVRDFLVFNWHRDYDLAPDGRFLMVFPADREEPDASARPRINIVLNWVEELKRLVPRP